MITLFIESKTLDVNVLEDMRTVGIDIETQDDRFFHFARRLKELPLTSNLENKQKRGEECEYHR